MPTCMHNADTVHPEKCTHNIRHTFIEVGSQTYRIYLLYQYQFYPQNILRIYDSHFVPILTLRTDNSGIVPCKVRILTLSANLGILTLRRAIPELSRFSLCAEHIYRSGKCKATCGFKYTTCTLFT